MQNLSVKGFENMYLKIRMLLQDIFHSSVFDSHSFKDFTRSRVPCQRIYKDLGTILTMSMSNFAQVSFMSSFRHNTVS